MTKNELIMAFDSMTPDNTQKELMLNSVSCNKHTIVHVVIPQRAHRKVWFGASAATACLIFVLALALMLNIGGGAVAYGLSIEMPDGSSVLMEDRSVNNRPTDLASIVSYVESRPQLRFFITGENIAKIEISCESEYLKAVDFTEKLDEKYWNPELYYVEKEVDGVVQKYVPTRSLLDKSHVLLFPEYFNEYDRVWYDWYAWDLMEWASEDDYSHYQKYNGMSNSELEKLLETASEEEKLAIAAGGGATSAAGHILLDGYPTEKLTDRVTITITDRQGNTVTKTLTINVSNNTFGQTVVTASISE